MSLGFILGNPNKQSIETLLDGILEDFQPPVPQFRPQQAMYPLKSLLVMLKSTGSFNPKLLKKLAREFHLDKSNKEVYVTRDQLLQEFRNPNVKNYSQQDLDDIYDFLRGDKNQVEISDIIPSDPQDMSASNRVKKNLSKDDLLKILEAQVSNVTK